MPADTPKIGLLGIGNRPHNPQLTQRAADFAGRVAGRLSQVAGVTVAAPVCTQEEIATAISAAVHQRADGIVVLMLTAEPTSDCALALADAPLPMLLANIQPERAVFEDWTEDDLASNLGVRGAQGLAHALVCGGTRLAVVTDDWISDGFTAAFADWAHAARVARGIGWSRSPTPAVAGDHGAAALLEISTELLGEAHPCTMWTMDCNRDSVLIRPSPGSAPDPGPATTAAMSSFPDGRLRLVIGSGELGAAPDLPQIGARHMQFAPDSGINAFLDAWLELGAPADFVITSGDQRARWRRLAELLDTAECFEI